jgi:acyl carrier protein
MDESAIYAELTKIFRNVFDDDEMTLRPDLTARDVHGWDSFKQIELIAMVEEKFEVELLTKDVDALQSVGDLAALVGRVKA